MKMISITKSFCVAALLSLLVTSSLAAEQTYPAYQQELQTTANQLTTQMNRTKAREQAKLNLAIAKATHPNGSTTAQPTSEQKNATQPQAPKQHCDCNKNTTLNIDPHNFLYSVSGERKVRLKPYCQCKSTTTSTQNNEEVTPVFSQTHQKKTSGQKPTSSFEIQY